MVDILNFGIKIAHYASLIWIVLLIILSFYYPYLDEHFGKLMAILLKLLHSYAFACLRREGFGNLDVCMCQQGGEISTHTFELSTHSGGVWKLVVLSLASF